MADLYGNDSDADRQIAADVARVFEKNFAEYNRNADRYSIGKMESDDRTYMINKSLAEVDARNKYLRQLAAQAAAKEEADARNAAIAASRAGSGNVGGNPYGINPALLPTAQRTSSSLANWQAGLSGLGTLAGLAKTLGLFGGAKNPYIEQVKAQQELQEYMKANGLLPKSATGDIDQNPDYQFGQLRPTDYSGRSGGNDPYGLGYGPADDSGLGNMEMDQWYQEWLRQQQQNMPPIDYDSGSNFAPIYGAEGE